VRNVHVGIDLDVDAFFELLLERIARLGWLSRVRGGAERRNVELPHLQHRLQRARGPAGIRVAEQPSERLRNHLPGEPVAILQPSALPLLAALGECAPVVVDLALVSAADQKRDGLAEAELGAPIDRREGLAVELEVDGQDGARRAATALALVGDVRDLRVREDRHVEVGSVLPFGVEPEVGRDAGH
jgi:hypothetical protein